MLEEMIFRALSLWFSEIYEYGSSGPASAVKLFQVCQSSTGIILFFDFKFVNTRRRMGGLELPYRGLDVDFSKISLLIVMFLTRVYPFLQCSDGPNFRPFSNFVIFQWVKSTSYNLITCCNFSKWKNQGLLGSPGYICDIMQVHWIASSLISQNKISARMPEAHSKKNAREIQKKRRRKRNLLSFRLFWKDAEMFRTRWFF